VINNALHPKERNRNKKRNEYRKGNTEIIVLLAKELKTHSLKADGFFFIKFNFTLVKFGIFYIKLIYYHCCPIKAVINYRFFSLD
jgi:hypothetical protein